MYNPIMMTQAYQPITLENKQWDAFVDSRDGHILQTARWAQLKRAFDWQDQQVALAHLGDTLPQAVTLMLYRSLPLNLSRLAYVPRGPVMDWNNAAMRDAMLAQLTNAARANGAFAIKFEPDLDDTPENRAMLTTLGLRESHQTVQPPRTILIDVSGDEDDILMRMSQSTRRKVRTPYKKGVTFRHGTVHDIETFSAVIEETSERNDFGVHSQKYYQMAYALFGRPGKVTLILAEWEGKTLGAIMCYAQGSRAWYFYGASASIERNRMATYGLQWEAIKWARQKGCRWYDMWGIPDEDEETLEDQFQRRDDGLWGVYGFKRGFGGVVSRSVGAWDLILNPLIYTAYETILKIRS